MKIPEKRRNKIVIVITAALFIRSLYLFLSKAMPLGFDNWKFYSSLLGAIGFLGLFIFFIKQKKKLIKDNAKKADV